MENCKNFTNIGFTKYTIYGRVTSFYVRRSGNQLFKLLSGEESGKEESLNISKHFPKTALEINRLMIPAEVILLFHKAVVDVAYQ